MNTTGAARHIFTRTRIHCKDKVKKLIEQFESHPYKESFLQDLNQTQKINKFSEESKDLIADMNNTEIFELCETSSNKQCPDCNLYLEIGIFCCTCGRCGKLSQRTQDFDNNNNDVSSILGYIIFLIKQQQSRAKHGPSERQRMYCKAKEVLQKGRQQKHGGYSSTLERWP